jgi:hypothetical protein
MILRDINVIKSTSLLSLVLSHLGHCALVILFHSQLYHVLPVIIILAFIMEPADLS